MISLAPLIFLLIKCLHAQDDVEFLENEENSSESIFHDMDFQVLIWHINSDSFSLQNIKFHLILVDHDWRSWVLGRCILHGIVISSGCLHKTCLQTWGGWENCGVDPIKWSNQWSQQRRITTFCHVGLNILYKKLCKFHLKIICILFLCNQSFSHNLTLHPYFKLYYILLQIDQ